MFIDESKRWSIQLDVGEDRPVELHMFQVTQDIPLGQDFPTKLQRLMRDEDHYLLGERVVGIMAPGNLDMADKPLFVVLSFIRDDPEHPVGSLNHYLLAELGGNVRLIAAADPELTAENFKNFIEAVTGRPENVENLVIAYHKK